MRLASIFADLTTLAADPPVEAGELLDAILVRAERTNMQGIVIGTPRFAKAEEIRDVRDRAIRDRRSGVAAWTIEAIHVRRLSTAISETDSTDGGRAASVDSIHLG
jgi:hypothetical protein